MLLNRQAQSIAIARGYTAQQARALDDESLSIVEGVVSPWPVHLGTAPTEQECQEVNPWLYHVSTLYDAWTRTTWAGQRPPGLPGEAAPIIFGALVSLRVVLSILLPEMAAMKQAINNASLADLEVRDQEAVLRAALDVIRSQS